MNDVLVQVAAFLNDEIITSQEAAGGCIAQSSIIRTISGKTYFLKQGFNNGMFKCEANGLLEIEKANCIRVPKVIMVEDEFLLLETVQEGRKSTRVMFDFGRDFAKMHMFKAEEYGFFENNFIGSNQQINTHKEKWDDFYFTNRLLYQYKLAEKNGYVTKELESKFLKLESQISNILEGSEEEPCLLHGDLWGGNYMVDENGKGVLIDPAVYYGHREADLAMTKLFGGFSSDFYQGYQDWYPFQEGYNYREGIYLLYHVLNHLNLFGSGYYSQTMSLLSQYV